MNVDQLLEITEVMTFTEIHQHFLIETRSKTKKIWEKMKLVGTQCKKIKIFLIFRCLNTIQNLAVMDLLSHNRISNVEVVQTMLNFSVNKLQTEYIETFGNVYSQVEELLIVGANSANLLLVSVLFSQTLTQIRLVPDEDGKLPKNILWCLKDCKNLAKITISNLRLYGPQNLCPEVIFTPNVTHIKFENISETLDWRSYRTLLKSLPNLEVFDFTDVTTCTTELIQQLFVECPKLTVLRMIRTEIRPFGDHIITGACPLTSHINVGRSIQIAENLKEISMNSIVLTDLKVFSCTKLSNLQVLICSVLKFTEAGAKALINALPNLKFLKLNGNTPSVTVSREFVTILTEMKNLRDVELAYCIPSDMDFCFHKLNSKYPGRNIKLWDTI